MNGSRRSRLQCLVIICFVFVINQHGDSEKRCCGAEHEWSTQHLQNCTLFATFWSTTRWFCRHWSICCCPVWPSSLSLTVYIVWLRPDECINCNLNAAQRYTIGGWWVEHKNVGVGWRMKDGALKVNADCTSFSPSRAAAPLFRGAAGCKHIKMALEATSLNKNTETDSQHFCYNLSFLIL